ncbi:MAG: hypothetical protein HRT87_11215 [Legionellales bacterium]|nr:hypothetical protein [Legionellales bacterium]
MYLRVTFLVSLFVILSGCGPVYRTTYYYNEPPTQRGRECVVKCQKMRQKCEHWAEQSYQQCLNRRSLERIATVAITRGDRTPAFANSYDNECQFERARRFEVCLEDFNACFQLCGGVVDSIEECVSNCD